MRLIREVLGAGEPFTPSSGWNVGHLANLGVLLSTDGFSVRFDLNNLNLIFDAAEDGEFDEVRDSTGRIVEVYPEDNGIILVPRDDADFPFGLVLDLNTLKEMGIEQYEEEQEDEQADYDSLQDEYVDPTLDFDPLENDDTVEVQEGIKIAFRRSGKRIKRGYRVTSGFRKGRVVSSPAAAFKPRKKASTRMKMKIAARRKKVIRVLKGKRTRRKPFSKRLVRLNKRYK